MCVILTPVAMIAMLASTTHHTSKTPVAASSGAASSAGKVAAMIQVEKWLKSTPNPLPNGRIVSWDGADDIPLFPGRERFRDVRHRFQGRGRPLHRAG